MPPALGQDRAIGSLRVSFGLLSRVEPPFDFSPRTYKISLMQDGLRMRAKFFRGLADPVRLSLLEALLEGPRTVGDLVRRSRQSQPNVSQHLTCLRCCGLVDRARNGRHVYYRIATPRMRRLLAQAADILREVAGRIRACENYEQDS